jgi:hypothetical protein
MELTPRCKFIVIKTRLVEVKGRKSFVEGRVQDTSGNVLAEAKYVFVHLLSVSCPISNHCQLRVILSAFLEQCLFSLNMPSYSILKPFGKQWVNLSRGRKTQWI